HPVYLTRLRDGLQLAKIGWYELGTRSAEFVDLAATIAARIDDARAEANRAALVTVRTHYRGDRPAERGGQAARRGARERQREAEHERLLKIRMRRREREIATATAIVAGLVGIALAAHLLRAC